MSFDIDIDLRTDFDPLKAFPTAVRASQVDKEGRLVPHVSGAYLQAVPIDQLTGLAAAPYKQADELGCFKIDFLHLKIYDAFSSKAEIQRLLRVEPDWKLLLIPSLQAQLFQLSKHGELLTQVKPASVLELADCLALIRPGRRFVLPLYLRDRAAGRAELYSKRPGEESYGFKKAHALSYAYVIVLQLHLFKAGVTFE